VHTKFKSENEYALTASMKVSHHITVEGEAHLTTGRTHIKICVIDVAVCMKDEKAARKFRYFHFWTT
jgi:hypothetical protein